MEKKESHDSLDDVVDLFSSENSANSMENHSIRDFWIKDIKNPCYRDTCCKSAFYGTLSDGIVSCSRHVKDGMIDFRKLCAISDCTLFGNFHLPDSQLPFCLRHKTSGMVNRNIPICRHKDCNDKGIYSVGRSKKKFCALHKRADMLPAKKRVYIFKRKRESEEIIDEVKKLSTIIPS